MPTGSLDYNPANDSPPTDTATPIVVCRFDPAKTAGSRYTLLPNIRCEQLQRKEGAEPSTAQFRYIMFDDLAQGNPGDSADVDEDPGYPSQFEETWPIKSASNAYKVIAGDRLVVLSVDPNGDYRVRFDGFAQVPQTDLSGGSQAVTFTGSGVEVRCWDAVIGGRFQRGGDKPRVAGTPLGDDPSAQYRATSLPTRFNPDNHPNCTPDGTDETLDNGNQDQYPVFLEAELERQTPNDPAAGDEDDPNAWGPVASFWTLGKLARYLLALWNTGTDASGNFWLARPSFVQLDHLLENRAPLEGSDFYDPADASTYTATPVVVRDHEATNRPWPEVLAELLGFHGFRMRFVCEGNDPAAGGGGGGGGGGNPNQPIIEEPNTRLELYRFDAAGSTDPKEVYLPVTRTALSIDRCNIAGLSAVNDFHSVANEWVVESRPDRYEVGILLAPAFQPLAADALAPAQRQYLKSNLDNAPQGIREMYRRYIADELAEGIFVYNAGAWIVENLPFNFTSIFDPNSENGDPVIWVKRYRAPIRTLMSKTSAGKVLSAQLALSRDYAGEPPPCAWDGSGTWQKIDGGYELLKDRLGIDVNVEDVNAWAIGKGNPPTPPAVLQEPSGTLQAITSMALWTVATPGKIGRQDKFFLRLTCVIEADQSISAKAPKRTASPYPFTIARRIDARDHFRRDVIDPSSAFYVNPYSQVTASATPTQVMARDDTTIATTHAEQMRAAHEFPPLSATIHLPWFAAAYQVGDRLKVITGREVSLQVNAGTEQKEAASYPFVVGVTWDLRWQGQSTTLQLSDRRAEPQHEGSRGGTAGY